MPAGRVIVSSAGPVRPGEGYWPASGLSGQAYCPPSRGADSRQEKYTTEVRGTCQ